jgi:feruloyl esterase
MKRRILCSAALLAAVFALGAGPALAATACENLASLALPQAKIDSAQPVAAGAFAPPNRGQGGGGQGGNNANPFANLPAFCRVTATLTPSSDSDIKTEIWLPASGWNGKFMAVGNGGWAGTIPYPALGAAVAAGYAGAGTDTGHVGNSAEFAIGHPEKLIDFGYRAIHEMTVQAKAVVNAHYGAAPRYSYFNGCSQGGRQGIASAQRYPADFDGIIAGASAWNQMRAHGARTALNTLVNQGARVLPESKYEMIHNAVLNACDARDGAKDGLLENPMACNFDYASLQCRGADAADCLTAGQVETAKLMTSPMKDPQTGRVLYEGHLLPGSELGWRTLGGPQPYGNSATAMRGVVFQDRNWDPRTINVSTDIERAHQSDNGALYSGDPNLRPFFERGGKLLMYHGWADPQVTPLTSVIYYNNVLNTVGKERAANSIALFMVPGMYHCQGGPGTDTFDKVGTLEAWVEQGRTPTTIIASHRTNGKVDKTRPLCAFPQVAKYDGSGDLNDAANFSCVADAAAHAH